MTINRMIGLMILLFIVEGTIMPWIIPAGYGERIITHFSFVMVIYSAMYSGRHHALLFGIGFGLLQDIVYFGHLIGAHAFAMGLIGYFTGVLLERKRATIMMALSMIGIACLLYDTMIFFIYKAFRITNETYAWAVLDHILPSLFIQLAFALAVYVPARRMFESLTKIKTDEEEQ